ncbi:MAG TPA: adenosine deaminase [Candidatus Tyrphobacter sp.]
MELADSLSLDAAVRAMPKVHLHCHLEGTLRPRTFLELAEREGIATPRDADSVYQFDDFAGFLRTFMAVCKSLRLPADYARMAGEFVADAREQNVAYGELFVSPSVWGYFHPGLNVREALTAIGAELRAAEGASFSLIVDVTRNLGAQSAMQTVDLALAASDCNVIGIGLGGDEARFPAELFADVFAYACAQGLHAVAHAGEAAGAASVRAAVEVLGAERIGHGVRALEDPGVVAMLAERRIPLEICPTSNFRTGAALRERPHPFLDLHAAGVPIVIDADDPALFGSSIGAEYRYVAQVAGSSALEGFVRDAIDAAFASAEQKASLHARLESAWNSARRVEG